MRRFAKQRKQLPLRALRAYWPSKWKLRLFTRLPVPRTKMSYAWHTSQTRWRWQSKTLKKAKQTAQSMPCGCWRQSLAVFNRNVRYWHLTDIPLDAQNVCFRGGKADIG